MASISVTIPDAKATEIRDAFARQLGRPDQIQDGNGGMIPNPESKTAFAKRMLVEYVKKIYWRDIQSTIEPTQAERDTLRSDFEAVIIS